MAKTIVKISDLAQLSRTVDISEDQAIRVRPLNLREMVTLFVQSRDTFLPLYAQGLDGKVKVEDLAPFILAAPDMVARIIAIASDEPESAEAIEKHMPATVQLVALGEIWAMSVPDQKKATQLLSEVTALLQRLEKSEVLVPPTPSMSMPTP